MKLNPYLNFEGTTEAAFNFYKSVFGGEFAMVMRFKDVTDGPKVSKEDENKIMHIALPIGENMILMATDVLESMGQQLTVGNNFSICVDTKSEDEADTLFAKLAIGGKADMPLEKTFWGAYFGSLTDKFGIQWMVNYTYPKKD
jgi:PhnB protein